MNGTVRTTRHRISDQPWRLWTNQVLTIMRIDFDRNLFARRAFWIYILAFAPVALIAGHAMFDRSSRGAIGEDTQVLAGIFDFYYVRLGIFFGCMGIFTWLFRGEVIEKTLHYYFLVPVRRELLIVGKFLSGVIRATLVFGTAVLAAFIIMYAHFGAAGSNFVFDGPGLGHLRSYLLITVLACLGYGAFFLALSLVFRNPIVPGLIFWGWEAISPILPSLLQKLTVTFYLKHLYPVDVPVHGEGLFALFTVITEPVSPWIAVLGLLCLTAAVVVFACFRIHKLEITYSTD